MSGERAGSAIVWSRSRRPTATVSRHCCACWEWLSVPRGGRTGSPGWSSSVIGRGSRWRPLFLPRSKWRMPTPMLVREQIATLEQAQVAEVPDAMSERRQLLQRLKALGPAFSATLVNELFYKDFRNRREVAAYCGLAPSPWKSGGIDLEQGISKAGNHRARHKAIELAWLWLRHQPDSALSRWFRNRTANAGKRARRIAIVALARKLIVALWRYLSTGLVPDQATMKA